MDTHQFWPLAPEDPSMFAAQANVWLAELEQPADTIQRLAGELASDELLRAQRFYFERDRRRFIVARGVLRAILSAYLPVTPAQLSFTYGPQGKPALAAPFNDTGLRFNVSHSHELALYAVIRAREIGVDIEWMRPLDDAENLAAHFFSVREQMALRSLPEHLKHQGFYNCWTRKEAFIKAVGKGLAQPLDEFDVSLTPGEPAQLLANLGQTNEAKYWSLLALRPPTGYAAALAVEGTGLQVKCWKWQEKITSPERMIFL